MAEVNPNDFQFIRVGVRVEELGNWGRELEESIELGELSIGLLCINTQLIAKLIG